MTFLSHLTDCDQCQAEDPCPVGYELLYEYAEELDDRCQAVLRRCNRRKEEQQDADANHRWAAQLGGLFQ